MTIAINKMFVTVIIISLLVLSCEMESEDKASELVAYCQNVQDGVWPDYEEKFDSACSEKDVKDLKSFIKSS